VNVDQSQPFFGQFGNELCFIRCEDCVVDAPELAWRPHSFSEYRRSKLQQERYFVQLYLRWLFERDVDSLRAPVVVTRAAGHMEPDFVIREGGADCGLEVTRATTWLLQRATDACLGADRSVGIELTAALEIDRGPERDASFDKRSFNPNHLPHEIGDRFDGDGWPGQSAEHCWADTMTFRIGEKVEKLRSNYRKTVSTCDLLLYSDVPAPAWDLDCALRLLRENIVSATPRADCSLTFRKVQIVCDHWVIFDALGGKPKIFVKPSWPPLAD